MNVDINVGEGFELIFEAKELRLQVKSAPVVSHVQPQSGATEGLPFCFVFPFFSFVPFGKTKQRKKS